MKYIVFIIFIITLDVVKCKVVKYSKNSFPKDSSIKYYTTQPYDIRIPIVMHIDKALMDTFPRQAKGKIRDKFKLIAKNMIRDSEEMFRRPNLHQRVKLELLDVKILRNNTKKVVMNENVSQYLRSYCQWQGVRKVKKQMWYFSVLFTGLDLFYLNNHGAEVRSSTGRGYQRGMCSNKNSCALLEWNPKNIAYILTHEIAHSLGISHDGPPHNECRGQRFIMDASYNPRSPAKTWSPCNKRELDRYLKSWQAWCLKSDSSNLTV